MPDESVLTHQMLVDLYQWVDSKTIYFIEERFCPKVDKDGDDMLLRVPMLGQQVWIMHPDLVPRFLLVARQAGFIPVPFDFEKMARYVQPKWEG